MRSRCVTALLAFRASKRLTMHLKLRGKLFYMEICIKRAKLILISNIN